MATATLVVLVVAAMVLLCLRAIQTNQSALQVAVRV
jgi:hypothetical protein